MEWEAETLLDLLGDSLSRRIIALTSAESLSADALTDRSDASGPTVYRRLDQLQEYGMLVERTAYDAEGNHFKTYECLLDELNVSVDEGSLAVDLTLRRDDGESVREETVGDADSRERP